MGRKKVVVLWDSGSTLPGLMTKSKYQGLRSEESSVFTNVVWENTPRPISGISDPPAMMVGQAVVSLMSKGRPVDVICSIMENGDTDRADIIVGNVQAYVE